MKKDAFMSRLYKDDIVECLACSHHCKIAPAKTGICGVRKNENGKLKLLVYGQAIAHHTDPIEKKPLFHFLPNSQIFSFGTVGCNFRCLFCQNADIAQFHKTHTEEEIMSAGVKLMPKDIVNYCLKNKIPSIAFTYNEPGIFFEYAYDTAKLAHKKGIKTVYVSNGFETHEALEKILPYLDAINIDLKSFRDDYYREICGGRIEPVKENIKWLWEKGVWVEVTTLLVTDENDTDKELKQIADFLAEISPDIPWHISRYFPCYKMNNPPTPIERLEKAYELGKQAGLHYVYLGNLKDTTHENTFCPKCGEILVERNRYGVKNLLEMGKCKKCGEEIRGVFNV